MQQQTPLMTQYYKVKEANPDTILLFRIGDFFETFDQDAKIASKVLGITLTKRANGAAEDVPLAGFPHHAIDTYLPKLVRAGFRVAVCEQMENPKFARGIVKREAQVIRRRRGWWGCAGHNRLCDQRADDKFSTQEEIRITHGDSQ